MTTTAALLCVHLTSAALATVAHNSTLHGVDLYDAMYKVGYHSSGRGLNTSRGTHLMPKLVSLRDAGLRSVLDIGSSNGFMVNWLWSQGFVASGMDISNVAVDLARRLRGEPEGRCVRPCFAQGTTHSIPFANQSFDAIVSSDVLEHVEATDVARTVAEFTRVARRLLVLKVSDRYDSLDPRMRSQITSQIRASGDSSTAVPTNLHTAKHKDSWWKAQFAAAGWRLHSKIPYPPKKPWVCCMFVLARTNSRPTPSTV